MGYREEFPDFTLDVEIPGFMEDTSWRQDACPSWREPSTGARLWVDYVDMRLREFPLDARFSIEAPDEGPIEGLPVETDRWDHVLETLGRLRRRAEA